MNGNKARGIRRFTMLQMNEQSTYQNFRKQLKLNKRLFKQLKSKIK